MSEKLDFPIGIEIVRYDSFGPEQEDNVASIVFLDLSNKTGEYCVGFKFLGGELSDPKNWEYDHTNFWPNHALNAPMVEVKNEEVLTIKKQEVEKILNDQGQSLQSLLEIYTSKL